MSKRVSGQIEWTPRQREVLDLLAKSRSNSEIANELGISLDGAKWHVSEILAKLGANSRDEAADYWRVQNGLRPRLTRRLSWLAAGSALRWAGGAVLGLAVVGGVVLLAMVLIDDDKAPPIASETPTPTMTSGPTLSPTGTVVE